MKSHLSRRVFRSILANEPIVHRGCLRRRAFSTVRAANSTRITTAYTSHNGRPVVLPPQRRTFFSLDMFGKKKKNVKDADFAPGLDVMMDLQRLKRMRARLPSHLDVADALERFANGPQRYYNGAVTDDQARLIYESIRYCLDSGDGAEASQMMQNPDFLRKLIDKIRRQNSQATIAHAKLAKLVYDLMLELRVGGIYGVAQAYVHALTCSGQTKEARDFVRSREPEAQVDRSLQDRNEDEETEPEVKEFTPMSQKNMSRLWSLVMRGFSVEGNKKELLQTIAEIERLGHDVQKTASPAMLDFYLQQNEAESLEHWLWRYWPVAKETMKSTSWDDRPTRAIARRLSGVFSWCLGHDQLTLGHEIVRQVMAENPPKVIWDTILVWAAGNGKGADEIDRMIGVMEASNKTIANRDHHRRPDIATINGLVEFAISKDDPYLAERFIAIGKERNILPDARTYVLQIQYRLKVKDVDGALIAYTNLQSMDISDDTDVPTINELLVALCNSKRHDFDTIMNVAADLSDRRARFEPQTVSALAILHLSRDEVHDVMDLLNTHAHHYSSTERESIRNTILDFALDPQTPTSRTWDGYTILREVFDEMPRSQRTDLMVSFFNRERPDMATHVFTGMRTHSRADTIPTVDTYVAAFLACAKLRDIDVLEVLHNQLKLDYNIDRTTYLYNALIIGYTASGKPRRALESWDDIVASKEGPTYNSIHIALRACEKAPFGDMKAQEIWRRLRKTSVELDQSMWASYAGALVGNGNAELAISTIEEAEAKGEIEIDAYITGSLFNGAPGQAKQAEVEAWVKEKHPHVWAELEKIGIDSDDVSMRSVKIDRSVTP